MNSNVELCTRHIVMPNHSNPNGLVFGGSIMSWIDLTAAMLAEKHSGLNVATVKLSEVVFKSPMKVGDHVLLEATIERIGNTSMEIRVNVFAEGPRIQSKIHTTTALVTMVGLDQDGKPTKVPKLS